MSTANVQVGTTGCGVVNTPPRLAAPGVIAAHPAGQASGAALAAPTRTTHIGLMPRVTERLRALNHFSTTFSISTVAESDERVCHQMPPRRSLSPQPERRCLRHQRGRERRELAHFLRQKCRSWHPAEGENVWVRG